ncbi:MAG: LPS assembly protein LptD [Holosporales bacterium]|nr:LPS assembly protein LptD [Holosporales bacterium]
MNFSLAKLLSSIRFVLFFVFLLLLLATESSAGISMFANRVSYDQINEIISASGNVLISQTLDNLKIRELHAERIEYNRKTKEIKLIGEAVIKEPTGDVMSAKNIRLDQDFKNAIARALVIILADSSKIKAQKGTKKNDMFTFENVSYSPCKEVNCKLPLWDLVADRAIYDKKEKKFIYKNVRLRLKGVPVFFSPYFTHPSSEVKRKTGLLSPILKHNSDIGFYAGFPFYIALANDRELKLTPFVNSRRRKLASGEYRQKFAKGDFDVSASILTKGRARKAKDETDKTPEAEKARDVDRHTRWHIDSSFSSHNLDHKRLTVRINRSSDVTYKSVYPVDLIRHQNSIFRETFNDSKIVFDKYDRSYFMTAETHLYQTSDKKTVPTVLPHVNFNYRKNDFTFDSDTLCISRKKEKSKMFARDFFRSTNKLSWNKSFNVSHFLFEMNSGLRTDFYNISESEEADNAKGKIYPILENQFSASMPFTSKIGKSGQRAIWGPKATFTSTETSNERANIDQNEDSIFDSCNDLNLYSMHRFGGYDVVENGERVAVGFEASCYNSKRRWINAFMGRSNNIGKRQKMKFAGRNSVVGRFVIKPLENISFRFRFVGMPIAEKIQLFETGIDYRYKNVFAGLGYHFDRKISQVQENGIDQIGINCGVDVNEFWSITGFEILNLKMKARKKSLAHGISANYKDECFDFAIGVFRTNFRHRDIKPKTGIILSIVFKNLGNLVKSNANKYHSEIGRVE